MAGGPPDGGPLFACLVPGRPLNYGFRQVSPKRAVLELPNPAAVREFSVLLLQPKLAPDHGVGIYYSLPPFNEWHYVGYVLLQAPTGTFRAPWFGKIPPQVPAVQIGLSLETLEYLRTLQGADLKEEERTLDSAMGIAQDLFTFMSSFAKRTGQFGTNGEMLVIPTNCIDLWFAKFKNKHRLMPYFWLKKEVEKPPA